MSRFPISVVLENIRSLYNVGSVFRTSDGAFIEKLYLSGYTGFPPRKEIDKTALGSVDSVPWERVPNTFEIIYRLRGMGYQIVSLEQTEGGVPYNTADYRFPVCLIVGNEVSGVSKEVILKSDLAVDIPMYGTKHSLNAAVAYGIAVYHIIEKYRNIRP
ncbi:MAG: RNA methyltransferase [Leptospirales bacterium]|nr:RNA methyltransferase [Leptospirales bacterium]